MICIYHNKDLDGYTSGAIVKLKYPNVKLIGYDYGQPIPELPEGEEVIMVDVSMPMYVMENIAKESGNKLTWIDHHISAINDYKKYIGEGEGFCNAILDNSISACEGTWKYFFNNIPTPMSILLLGEYDTWRNQDKNRWDNIILPFQYGMRTLCNNPETFSTLLFYKYDLKSIINIGESIIKYNNMTNETLCKKNAFEMNFKGYRAICVNGGGFGSDTFKSVYNEEKHDLMMPFQYNGKFWTVSLYTTKDNVNCSELAKSMGGGGHLKAAGFQINNIYDLIDNYKYD